MGVLTGEVQGGMQGRRVDVSRQMYGSTGREWIGDAAGKAGMVQLLMVFNPCSDMTGGGGRRGCRCGG